MRQTCDVAWIRSIVEQCQAAAVPVFVKQLGRYIITDGVLQASDQQWPQSTGCVSLRPGQMRKVLSDRKGGMPSEWPPDLRVREFPETREGICSIN
jgi:hypothetical protein